VAKLQQRAIFTEVTDLPPSNTQGLMGDWVRDVSRHKSMDVLQAYVRDADLFWDHAGVGLL